MKKALLILIISSIVLIGCEGMKQMSGIVISETTGKPLQYVEINVLNNIGDSTKTDSLGVFAIKTGLTGMMFGVPKFKFEVRREGYETQIVKTKFGADTIKLVTQ